MCYKTKKMFNKLMTDDHNKIFHLLYKFYNSVTESYLKEVHFVAYAKHELQTKTNNKKILVSCKQCI